MSCNPLESIAEPPINLISRDDLIMGGRWRNVMGFSAEALAARQMTQTRPATLVRFQGAE